MQSQRISWNDKTWTVEWNATSHKNPSRAIYQLAIATIAMSPIYLVSSEVNASAYSGGLYACSSSAETSSIGWATTHCSSTIPVRAFVGTNNYDSNGDSVAGAYFYDRSALINAIDGLRISAKTSLANNKITDLGKGTADTDAINLSQLRGSTNALGGGSAINADGTIKAPTYTIQGNTYNDVGGALGKLDSGLTSANTNITNITNNLNNGKVGLVQQSAAGANITVAKGTDGAKVDFTGKFARLGSDGKQVTGTDGKPVFDSKDRVLAGVAKGTADNEAVNVKQLKDAGVINSDGSSKNAVTYDSATKDSLTLGGGANGTTITNLAKGKNGTDAVNVDQLKAIAGALGGGATLNSGTGAITAPSYAVQGSTYDNVGGAIGKLDSGLNTTNTNIANLTNSINNGTSGLVQQASAGADITVAKSKDGAKVNFAGTKNNASFDRVLTGVAKGTNDSDAVNMKQLKDAGIIKNDGTSLNAVVYDSDAKSSITLGGGASGTTITNVAKGKNNTDAANLGQVKDVATALGGGAGIDANGNITRPSYVIQGQTKTTVGDALSTLDTSVTNITNNLNSGTIGLVQQASAGKNITVAKDTDGTKVDFTGKFARLGSDGKQVTGSDGKPVFDSKDRVLAGVAKGTADNEAVNVKQLKDAGVINSDGTSLNAVVYDSNAKSSITLGGGANGTTITNLAKGKNGKDAANIDQLKGLAGALGGGAGVNGSNGEIIAPTYTVQGEAKNGVNGAIGALDQSITTLHESLDSGAVGLVRQERPGSDITVAKDLDGAKVDFAGTFDGEEDDPEHPGKKKKVKKDRVLTGVDEGVADSDAVNMKQLKKSGLFDENGEALNAVVYDGSNKATVTFGGGAAGTILDRVGAGLIAANSMQAINGGQLFAMRSDLQGKIDGLDGRVDKLEVKVNGDGSGNTNIGSGNNTGSGGSGSNGGNGSNGSNGSNGGAGGSGSNGSNGGTGGSGSDGSNGDAGGSGSNGGTGGSGSNGNNVAVGNDNNVGGTDGNGHGNVGVGNDNTVGGNNSQGIGNGNQVAGDNSIGQGNNNNVSGDKSQGIGNDNTVAGDNSIGQGNNNNVSGDNSQGQGNNNQVAGDNSQGTGNGNNVAGNNSKGDGNNNNVSGNESLGIGNNNTVPGDHAQGIGNGNQVAGHDSQGQGNSNNVTGDNSLGIGNNNTVAGDNSQGIGNGNNVAGDNSVGQGNNNNVSGNNGTATGNNNTVTGQNGIAEGNNNTVAGNNGTGVGFGNNVAGDNGIGIGNGTNVGGHNGIAVGTGSQANGNNSVAIGPGAKAPADDAVALGSNALADRNNTVSVGSSGHERQITNVAAGTHATDAVNVGQLNNAIGGAVNTLNQRVDDVWQQARKWNRQANQGIAAASALVNNMPYVPGHVALSAGVATFRGESALGVAASRWSEDGRVNLNAGVSFAGSSAPIFRVGVGVVL